MLKIIKERELKEETYYTYDFNRNNGSGFTFPCNENGEVKLNKCNKESYEFCLKHRKDFAWEGVIKHKISYWEPAVGQCSCGEKLLIEAQYMGAFQCPKCKQWYNLFGQKLLPPNEWEEDYEY